MLQTLKLQTAELDWELVDGIEVPISKQFGDVYFLKITVYSKHAMCF
jgi:tRNA 5-methylaminomethyl-2-thiouridine biosynthesis bifunctional protein